MLKMSNVSKVYRTDTVETHALREFSLSVGEGEFLSVTGPSGSGKTTFLNIAGLLEELSGGSYELDGRDISSLSDKERSKVRWSRRQIQTGARSLGAVQIVAGLQPGDSIVISNLDPFRGEETVLITD